MWGGGKVMRIFFGSFIDTSYICAILVPWAEIILSAEIGFSRHAVANLSLIHELFAPISTRALVFIETIFSVPFVMTGIKSSVSMIIEGVFSGSVIENVLVAITNRQIYIIKHFQFCIFCNAALNKKVSWFQSFF